MKQFFHILLMCIIYATNIRFIPAYIAFLLNKEKIEEDFAVWRKMHRLEKCSEVKAFFNLFWKLKEFRTLLYFRLGHESLWFSWLAAGIQVGNISPKVGPGFYICHGNGSRLNAKSIGRNFQVWHGVTIGIGTQFDVNSRPTIGDNVKICAGAIVVGNITIGNNVTIGAGSVVVKSVPDNCLVVGNPARIIKKYDETSQKWLSIK